MRQFAHILSNLNKQLDIPQPEKARIILEIGADLEDLYAIYREQGKSEREAQILAEEKFNLDEESIRELVSIHQSAFRKLMNRFSLHTRTRVERMLLCMILLSIAAFAGHSVVTTPFFHSASIFIYPLFGLGLGILATALQRIYVLFVKRDHNIRTLRNGLTTLLFLGSASVFFGVWGYFLEIYTRVGTAMLPTNSFITLITTVNPGQEYLARMVDSLIKSSSVMMATLFFVCLTAVFWFVLLERIEKIEKAEMEHLLG
ncbi:hypothetical protein JW935_04055 [candidate division KSB1 bacterium]|nr:hypothetical protein [candidate division KSB1 bacterium]